MRLSPRSTMAYLVVVAGVLLAACTGGGAGADRETGSVNEVASGRSATSITAPPRRSFTLAATGDLLIHAPVWRQAAAYGAASGRSYDFGPMLAEVAPVLSWADLALCHLEVPLSRTNRDLSSFPRFNGPRELAPAIAAAGWDTCSVASNHALDQGPDGVAATLEALDAAGVAHAGTARNPAEDAAVLLLRPGGVRVAQLSYTYGLSTSRVPPDQPWLVDLIETSAILADAAAARAAGAELVVVSLHWGAEFRVQPTPAQRELATALLASPDVDLILGHHAHVVQPVERVGDKVVVYGMGNFLSNQSPRCCPAGAQDGVIVYLTVQEQPGGGFRVTRIAAVPTWVERPTYRIRSVPAALADPATPPAARSALMASQQRTTAALGPEVTPMPVSGGNGAGGQ